MIWVPYYKFQIALGSKGHLTSFNMLQLTHFKQEVGADLSLLCLNLL